MLEKLVAGHAMGGVVRAGGDATRVRRGSLVVGVAQVAIDRFHLRWLIRRVSFVRLDEDATVGTIRRAKTAADAVVLDDDLHVLAAVDGVDRAAGHAVGRVAGTASRGDHVVGETLSVAEHPGHGHAVRFGAVALDAAARAFVAAGAAIEVEHEHTARFV